jgi:hypothetical protein
MTEFEMAYLMTDMQAGLMASTTTLFTITSAFLVAGYLVSHRLSRLMVGVAIAVFSWAFFTTAFITSRQIFNLLGLVVEINKFANAGKGLAWHAAAQPIVDWAMQGGTWFFIVFCTLAFIGSIAFFFHSRRVNQMAEAGTWKPKHSH